jgi:3-oxoacyl-[acyl-carrier-protein] synthase-3
MAFIRGFGSYLPSHIVTNDELAKDCAVEPSWILEMSGIEERRYAADGETVTTLGIAAAQDCVRNCGISPTDLGLILVSSGSSERFCPGPAANIAFGLGLNATPALDIPVASAGSLIGIALAAQLAPSFGKVLVVGSEIMSRRVQRTPQGKNTAILFGDGAGAVLIDPAEGMLAITGQTLFTDGSASEVLHVTDGLLVMNGQDVIMKATRKIPAAIKSLFAEQNITGDAVAQVLMHQANLNLIKKVATSIGVPIERFFVNIQRYGNTSSASMLIAAHEWDQQRAGAPIEGPVLLTAFGTGLNWGALLASPAT